MAILIDDEGHNPRMNKADLKDHGSVVAIFKDGDKILVEDHIKYDFLIPPSGKIDPKEPTFHALRREVMEETGLLIDKAKKIFSCNHVFIREGKEIKVGFIFFEVEKYHGTLENKEPNKHRKIYWESINKLRRVRGKISHALFYYLKYLDGNYSEIDNYKKL